ncbi:MAG: hypothetical protein EXS36_11640 [Pedosphaera sp.]|nr:hypothetical protein [Pedosphaera sp.]
MDRGHGYVDAAAALALLQSGGASDAPGLPGDDKKRVQDNIKHGAVIKVENGKVTRTASNLSPGEHFEIYYHVPPDTGSVIVDLSGFTAGPPPNQNQLFGDDIFLTVHSAKTSAIGEGDYRVYNFTTGGTFVINDPDEGLMRITLNGDSTNGTEVGATVTIFSLKEKLPGKTLKSRIVDGGLRVVPFKVAAGAGDLSALL